MDVFSFPTIPYIRRSRSATLSLRGHGIGASGWRIILNIAGSLSKIGVSAAGRLSLKLLLVLEISFAGIYLALTRNLLVIYLASQGFDISEISLMLAASTILSSALSVILYKYPRFLTSHVKAKFMIFHASERIFWIPMIVFKEMAAISFFYAVVNLSSTVLGSFMNLLIYSSFDEAGVRDVTSKRTAAYNATNIIGSIAAIVLLAALPAGDKFAVIFTLGSLIGLLSTLMLLFMDMRHLEGAEIPKAVESPEQMFSISSFFLAFLISSNLLGIFWAPYLMNVLHAPDYVAAGMNFAATISSILGSLAWAKRSLKTFRIALGLSALTPLAAFLIPIPLAHIGISAFNGFAGTGAGFLGNFLFARYLRKFGAVRSSIMMSLLSNLSQLLAIPFGIFFGHMYLVLFLSVVALILASMSLAFLTIPEVAVVPEHSARTYSYILYTSSLMGYSIAVETTKETVITSLRLLAFSLALILVYVIYRFLFFLAGL